METCVVHVTSPSTSPAALLITTEVMVAMPTRARCVVRCAFDLPEQLPLMCLSLDVTNMRSKRIKSPSADHLAGSYRRGCNVKGSCNGRQ